jgi:hypothetical protein
MDAQRFDDLVKRVASTSRRRVLSSLLGGLAAAIGLHDGDAAKKKHKKRTGKKPSNKGRTKKHGKKDVKTAAKTDKPKKCGGQPCPAGNTCLTKGGQSVCCPDARVCGKACLATPCPAPCRVCEPTTGACVNAADGTGCDDGNPCTGNDRCTGGTCVGDAIPGCGGCQGASDCPTLSDDPCEETVCDQGTCTVRPRADGTPCDDGNACTADDRCTAGVCAGTLKPDCVACGADAECASVPVEPCRQAVCGTGGTCVVENQANGTACDDGDRCTQGDTCQGGSCQPGAATVCPDATCKRGVCDPGTGGCGLEDRPDGTACDDGDQCTVDDTCQEGACRPGPRTTCPPTGNPCTEATCNPANGSCETANRQNGAACDDGNPCTDNDRCDNGVCAGTQRDDCVPCQGDGDCSGVSVGHQCEEAFCTGQGFCAVRLKPNGSPCNDGNACTSGETCQNGVCGSPTSVRGCVGTDPCKVFSCDPDTGLCVSTNRAENTPCGDGRVCCGGTCLRNTTTTNCGTCGTQCGPNQTCENGQCICPSPRATCSNGCCAAGQVCRNGTGECCAPTKTTCVPDVDCGDVPDGCGNTIPCGNTCANPTPICTGNTCSGCTGDEQCGANQRCCDGSCVAGVCCAAAECAPSGNACADHQCRCGSGTVCSAPKATCCGTSPDGVCTDTQTDAINCGACGTTCTGATPVCNGSGVCACGDVCPVGCRFTSIQAAINAAAPGATIRVCAGTYTERFTITKNLTLLGAGAGANPGTATILNGGGTGTVVVISSNAIATIQDLTITGGKASATSVGGGGIRIPGTLRLVGVSVIANTSELQGGGIYIDFGRLTLGANTILSNNSALNGGGIWNNRGTLTLEAGSNVLNNTATEFGGGIMNHGTLTLETGSSVSDNSAGSGGAGITIGTESSLTMQADSHVEGNKGTNSNSAGGGINNHGILVLDGIVVSNTANSGGGIYNAGTATLQAGSRVENNGATQVGGGIRNGSGTMTLKIGSRVTSNTAGFVNGGGGVHESGGEVSVADSLIVTLNTAGGLPDNCRPMGAVPNCVG